ncbi:MAG TPA: hypothetical protein VK066_32205 [Chloroflexota bacterium]|nr:hypothetical protein [Chloroflexota bacterium]
MSETPRPSWSEQQRAAPAGRVGAPPAWAAAARDRYAGPRGRGLTVRRGAAPARFPRWRALWCLALLLGVLPGFVAIRALSHTTLGSALAGARGWDGSGALVRKPPTLDAFWDGQASWRLDTPDVGLPMGESDTLVGPDGQLWSYLHASFQSAGIRDEWGAPVPFPGCVTLWKSADGGRHFTLTRPTCLIDCLARPCDSTTDHVDQQQYPRVARDARGGFLMVYEWRGWNFLRTSADGLHWSAAVHVGNTRQWNKSYAPCQATEAIGPHPYVAPADDYQCSVGGPPGIFVADDTLYVFVGLGKNPGHMGCYTGPIAAGAAGLRRCQTEPLFSGAPTYGPRDVSGPGANSYFDFRTISAADVLRVGERYYMAYEGVRGPSKAGSGDDQFNLGFARSTGARLDGAWEKYPGNPVLMDAPGNVGVGHADLLVLDGTTYLYTATANHTRGRYVLDWRP